LGWVLFNFQFFLWTARFLYTILVQSNFFPPIIFIIAAYKHADGKKIDGRRVLVDVERARTVKGWLPRRLGKLILFLT